MIGINKKIIAMFISGFLSLSVFAQTGNWFVCVGSFAKKSSADELVLNLSRENIDCKIKEIKKGTDLYFRVLINKPFKYQSAARIFKNEVESFDVTKKLNLKDLWICEILEETSVEEIIPKQKNETEEKTVCFEEMEGLSPFIVSQLIPIDKRTNPDNIEIFNNELHLSLSDDFQLIQKDSFNFDDIGSDLKSLFTLESIDNYFYGNETIHSASLYRYKNANSDKMITIYTERGDKDTYDIILDDFVWALSGSLVKLNMADIEMECAVAKKDDQYMVFAVNSEKSVYVVIVSENFTENEFNDLINDLSDYEEVLLIAQKNND